MTIWLLIAGAVWLLHEREKDKPKILEVDIVDGLGMLPESPPPFDGDGDVEAPPAIGDPCEPVGNVGYFGNLRDLREAGPVCSPSLTAWKAPQVGDRVRVRVRDTDGGFVVREIPDWVPVGDRGVVYKGRLRLRPSVAEASAIYAGMIGYPVNLAGVALYGRVRGRYGFGPSVSDGQSFMEFLKGVAQGK